ncbi:phosphopantothenate--cysteine ligase [Ihubacter massiliensis]|uniref:Phosphopantothenate--cysteine ligase n=1 Tax=Hominibacterium faecale TaxID=2839743 RepID=A0A9J6QTW8_9FIRM|nr:MULTISPECIES: phosphopantothenoylcysteine decarboxylase [Eubacteriales Family XIII. Incertae Sedis]MCO7123349.1 phosphopantothenate--cysteine ligase [Ihubacter massiliensis]MCU7379762.1 phosphopantothenate--cysteine ligase [Hominibacterium faecale]MDE8735091.1 phosphopantothenoylcysteine decarboxylase [Eubacteriales bacterium DFI.9.88]
MKIIITAGGTSERIDDVRSITNTSTGRLGHAIGERFLDNYSQEIDQLYYLHGLRAQPLEGTNVTAIPIEGVRDLEAELKRLLTEERIDGVIHAMAVSDYMVREVTTLEKIKSGDTTKLEGNKISSNIDDLTIIMQRSPKVIRMIKKLSPQTTLVGFKLLSHVPHEELIQVGYGLLQKNDCSFVLANDLAEIGPNMHKGYLIHRDGTCDSMENNEQIADMIAKRVWEETR